MCKKFKLIKKVFVINILCLLILTAILTVFYAVLDNKKKDTSTSNAASVYNFDSGVLTQANYNSCSTFEISSAEGLINFSNTKRCEATMFVGKTVTLTADINMSEKSWSPIGYFKDGYSWNFGGTFDGGGYTIKKLTQVISHDFGTAGCLFYGVAGTVKNLRIEEMKVTAQPNSFGSINVDGVAALACRILPNAVIEQIEVSGFTFNCSSVEILRFSDDVSTSVCGLVSRGYTPNSGSYSAIIKNCYVSDVKIKPKLYTKDNYPDYYYDKSYKIFFAAVGPTWADGFGNIKCNISNCVYKPYTGSDYKTPTEIAFDKSDGYEVSVLNCVTETCIDANFQTTYSGFKVIDKYGASITTITKNLSPRYENSEPIWFYNAGYNGGYARLTQFMDVQYQFYIPSDCTHQGTLDNTSVIIRYGLGVKSTTEGITIKGSQTKKGVMLLGNTTINATPELGYSFVDWEFGTMDMSNDGIPLFKCKPTFITLYYTLTFESVSKSDVTVNPTFYNNENAFTASGNELQILGGGLVEVNINKVDNIYSYIVTGNIKIGNSVTYTTVNVRYDLANLRRYTIDLFGIGDSSIGTGESYNIVKDETVKPTFKLKSYNSIFK